MTDAAVTGDAIARLVQLHAKRAGVHLKWTGKGNDDLIMLVAHTSSQKLLAQCLWTGMKELWDMPELKQLSEPVYTKICSIILKAQANFEVRLDERNKRAAKIPVSGPQPPKIA